MIIAGLMVPQQAVAEPPPPPDPAAITQPYLNPTLPVEARVSDLLGRMDLDEKIGQMTQAERSDIQDGGSEITDATLGSVLSGAGNGPETNAPAQWADMYDGFQEQALATRLKIPLIYGIDAVHGHNSVVGATVFPHNIGLGATRNPRLAEQIGAVTAAEVSGTGIDWTFSPCVCVARNDRWGRTYESFGETPEIVSPMSTIIDGLQRGPHRILATAKHYVGDGGTTRGSDQGNTEISEAELRAIHLAPFAESVRRGVGSVMLSYNQWNGQYLHNHPYLVNTVLKGELGFTGFVITDWRGIQRVDGNNDDLTAQDVRVGINAGIDMAMVPGEHTRFIALLTTEVTEGRVPMARIDDANRRILTQKFRLGLFERPLTDRALTATIGSAPHRALARQAVRESQVLLKNDGKALPLAKNGNKIFVAGKSAHDIGNQSGGWTISWQGASGPTTQGTTILDGIRSTVAPDTEVEFNAEGTGIDNTYKVAVAVVGEKPYAEFGGDLQTGMTLDQEDLAVLTKLKATGVPVIVVLVSGRPLDISAELPTWNALLAAWLPGTEGNGVSDVLFGGYRPTGRLPMTWMESASQQPINEGDGKNPLFPLGFGLTY